MDEVMLAKIEEHAEDLLFSATQDAKVPTMSLATASGISILTGWDVGALATEIRRLWKIEAAARRIDRANKICKGVLYAEYADKLDALHDALKAEGEGNGSVLPTASFCAAATTTE